jgi:hypothetical protein
MVKILKNEKNVVWYECDCGVKGKCMVKPLESKAAIVVDVKCPVCLSVERVVLLQYESEEEKLKIKNDLNKADLAWSSVVSNEVVEFLSKEENDDE